MELKRVFVTVKGIVQGVGFRPFVYNLALNNNLKGWVNNNSEGVYIDIEGRDEDINNFIFKLKHTPPPLSKIESLGIENREIAYFKEFTIKESEKNLGKITLISPDIALCKDCEEDILNPKNKRYFYPFTNCTNCGPRFSIIKSIPYDRDKTTMESFKMCSDCRREYENPLNRRFHAQPNACGSCGPNIYVTDKNGEKLKIASNYIVNSSEYNEALINWVEKKLGEGSIFAIKGLTGFHLVCDGKNESAVALLRDRKRRPAKPFALIMKDMNVINRYCYVDSKEEEVLTGIRKPIVLVSKKNNLLPEAIAPTQNTLGVMLPYTPLHKLLFQGNLEVLIMTSANISGLPLEHDNNSALNNLSDLVDYYLMHNRDIHIPVDDSVTRVVQGEESIIRRARGYAPEPLRIKNIKPILACGPNMKNTFAIAKEEFVFISPHNGDLENLETIDHYERNIKHFQAIFEFKPEFIACDLHPHYGSTRYAKSLNLPLVEIQHHHAHIVSCMVDNDYKEPVIGVAFDGTGYGTDGRIWGGEFLICDEKNFNRIAHFDYIPMVGGDKAIVEPWRLAVSYLYATAKELGFKEEVIEKILLKIIGNKALTLLPIIKKNINTIENSSIGRLFDAVSAILGFNHNITYEGQAAIELENLLYHSDPCSSYYNFKIIKNDETFIIKPQGIIFDILKDIQSNTDKALISRKFHNTIVKIVHDICIKIRDIKNMNTVALSGGVFQNNYLWNKTIEILNNEGFKVLFHKKVPTNDGGIALGQIVIANNNL